MEAEHGSEPVGAGDGGAADGASVGAVTPPPAVVPEALPPPAAPPAYAPPAYAPPQYGTPAPPPPPTAPGESAPYSPPPMYAPMPMPPAFAPPPPARKGSRTPLIVGIVAVLLILLLGGLGVLANASLSSTYSPTRAVTDYLRAQARGDVSGMFSNATFTSGDSTSAQFFTRDAVTSMLSIAENRAITDVSVTSSQDLDSSTSKVTVSMRWNDTRRIQTYTVRKDPSRVHDLFYYSWRVGIPSSAISVTLPNQPGAVRVDAIAVSSPLSIQVIQGYHTVTMQSTNFYDEASQLANTVDGTASVSFPSKMGSNALASAAEAVKAAFANVTCDVSKYYDCPNHPYKVRAGYYDILPAPGGDIRANSSWSIAFTGDPTTAMTLVITADANKVTAGGPCTMTLTVDSGTKYNFKGDWSGTLTWSNGGFASDLTENCDSSRA